MRKEVKTQDMVVGKVYYASKDDSNGMILFKNNKKTLKFKPVVEGVSRYCIGVDGLIPFNPLMEADSFFFEEVSE